MILLTSITVLQAVVAMWFASVAMRKHHRIGMFLPLVLYGAVAAFLAALYFKSFVFSNGWFIFFHLFLSIALVWILIDAIRNAQASS